MPTPRRPHSLLFRHTPFTAVMLVLLVIAAVTTNTDLGELSRTWLAAVGFAPRDLLFFRVDRVITSAVVTAGWESFLFALVATAIFAGGAEHLRGTRRAALTFWGVHILTIAIESLAVAIPLHLAGSALGTALTIARDVGPSAGFVGCAGLLAASLPSGRWRSLAVGGGLLFVALLLGWSYATVGHDVVDLSANLAHALAFPLGVGSAFVGSRRAVVSERR